MIEKSWGMISYAVYYSTYDIYISYYSMVYIFKTVEEPNGFIIII